MKTIHISVLLLFTTLSINLYASDLNECKGSPLEVDRENDTSKELRNSWTNCSATVTFTDGNKYVAEFKDGKFNGQGTYTYADGDKYVGEFKDGKIHGQGTYTWAEGNKYVGEWKDSKRHGQGTFTFASGDKHVGEFKDDKKDGQGTYTFADGRELVGEFKDGKIHGQGTYTWPNGQKYVGEVKDGKPNGHGTYTWPDGGKYVGEVKDQRNGHGIHYYADGDIYDGGWQGDKWHGKGVYYEKDQSRVVVSEFINGATHPKKSNLAFKVSESDIFLRCLYKGVQFYKNKDNTYDDYQNVGGILILLEGYKHKTKGYLQSFSLNFKKEYSLIGEPDKMGDEKKMDVLRTHIECDNNCIADYLSGNAHNDLSRKNELNPEGENIILSGILHVKQTKYYKKNSDPTRNLYFRISGDEFGLNRKNLRLYTSRNHESDRNYYQCTMEPVVEFWMFASKMVYKNKLRKEKIEQQKREEASKNQL
tara:strand:- start:1102 stop:2532 length:1431 start_codon:yes stop_codon:yes gene_type:complete